MTDLALIWDNAAGRADFAVVGGDIAMDDGLYPSIVMSLFCDALMPPELLPPGTTDRRGWCGDAPLSIAPTPRPDTTGSLLYLDMDQRQTPAIAARIKQHILDALRWMTEDGVAQSVDCTVSFPAFGQVAAVIAIQQPAGPSVYDLIWSASR